MSNLGLQWPRRCFPPIYILYIALFNIILILAYKGITSQTFLTRTQPVQVDDGDLLTFNAASAFSSKFNYGSPLRITILESAGVHDEVVSAFLHSFGGVPNSEITMYLRHQRYGIRDVIKNFTLNSQKVTVHKWGKFGERILEEKDEMPHIVVATTCEFDLSGKIEGPHKANTQALNKLREAQGTYLFCAFHHAEQWDEGPHVDQVRKWVDLNLVDFIGLSEHTTNYLRNATQANWDISYQVSARTLPPLFPIIHPVDAKPHEYGLAMQGDYDAKRRDYKGIFGQLPDAMDQARTETQPGEQAKDVVLHLIGHGKHPKIPMEVKYNVEFDESLEYPDFYALMSRQFAILPAFASDDYFDKKASSSVPAALIAGAPIVASEELLKAYSYVPKEATWAAEEGETDMDVVLRALKTPQGTFSEKRQKTREATERILEENRQKVQEWIEAGRVNLKDDGNKWTKWLSSDSR